LKRLVVTADDVALHPATTDAAIRAHQQGIVTACSVVASGADFERAVGELRSVPTLDVGVHLALVEERPVSRPSTISSLLAGERFPKNYFGFLARYPRMRAIEIERELRAQIERVLGAGLELVHLNSHQHLHMLPALFRLTLRLAADYRIPYVRIVDDHGGSAPILRRLSVAALSGLGRRNRARAAVPHNSRTVGIAEAGRLTEERLTSLIPFITDRTELVTHPATGGSDLAHHYDWGYSWDEEFRALCSAGTAENLTDRGIVTTSIRTLLAE
jgi:predicted glycoside hydrolase/deacetylase ChbG (UPF0249 family)